jgi:cell division septation protein DedD
MLRHFRSVDPIFATNAPTNDSQEFTFVTIRNPEELRQRARQSLIRKHAKQDVDRAKVKRHRATIESLKPLTIKSPKSTRASTHKPGQSKSGQISARHDQNPGTGVPTTTETSQEKDGSLSLDTQRLLPLNSYPLKPTPRMVQLFNFSNLTKIPENPASN